ncbi:MAG TPA: hypothetical protein VGN17_05300 [Bryobacteraceae bacterium]
MSEHKKATFNLDADLHQHLKVSAAIQRREMVGLLEEALQSYFGWNRMTDIETKELKVYELADSQGKGQEAQLDFGSCASALGCNGSDRTIAAQLLQYLDAEGRIMVDVWDSKQYKPLRSFPDAHAVDRNGGYLHVRLTVPGRIRQEQLQQRQRFETAQYTTHPPQAPGA